MKQVASRLLLFVAVAGMTGCGSPSTDKNNPGGIRAQSTEDSPTPYPVADSDRTKAVDELVELRKKMLVLEGNLIAPAKEDLETYADFLRDQNSGLARVFPRTHSDGTPNERKPLLVNGGGSYYQFKTRTNEYGYGSDIQYSFYSNMPEFNVGFGGVDYGFFAQLGKTDIRHISAANSSIAFALSYPSVNGEAEPAWRAEQRKWRGTGVVNGGVLFKSSTQAVVGMSYVVRSIIEGRYDIVAVFQVVRRDPADGSLIIAWKLLKEFDQPVMKRN